MFHVQIQERKLKRRAFLHFSIIKVNLILISVKTLPHFLMSAHPVFANLVGKPRLGTKHMLLTSFE